MGVCALQHRIVTGRYNSVLVVKRFGDRSENPDDAFLDNLTAIIHILGVLLYVYILCILMALFIDASLKQNVLKSYPMKFSFNIPASEISPTILIILLILHLLKTTKNTNPLNQIKRVFV